MSILAQDQPRVLVAAGPERQPDLLALFHHDALTTWEPVAADSFAHARFVLQHFPCDVLLVDSDLIEQEGNPGFTWLAFQQQAPIVLLGDDQPVVYARAYDLGAAHCLPRRMAIAHPPLLHSVLQQTVQVWDMMASNTRMKQKLAESCRHVDRLVQMIWRITPRHEDQWYSQRHMMERLNEELARCQRHKLPLSIALGEVQAAEDEWNPELPAWSTQAIVKAKRRCDVVGHYGAGGFMLLMVHTPRSGGVTCCKRLQAYLQHPAQVTDGPHQPVRSFFGLASLSDQEQTAQSLLRIAEENLDAAKERREECVMAG
jgi:diguanylate cyclase (GGDEF)-like protein